MTQPKITMIKFDGDSFNIKSKHAGPEPPTPASIHSKYDIMRERNAFGCSIKRFDDVKTSKMLGPGPGQYSYQNKFNSSSASTRGCYASQNPRFGSNIEILASQHTPGPTSYKPIPSASKPSIPQISFGTRKKDSRKCRDEEKCCPCSASYNVEPRSFKCNNSGAVSFRFTSRNDSDMVLQSNTEVAVGSYEVGAVHDYMERLGKEPRKGKDFPCPIFRSNSRRLAQTESLSLAPAPGYYEVIEPQDIDKLFRPSACFDHGLDRFGKSSNILIAKEDEDTPAPDSYHPICIKKNNNGVSASFASKSRRFVPGECDLLPGPHTYRPSQVMRKSFLQNRSCQWV